MWINKGNIHFRTEELQEQESNLEESPEDKNYGGQEVYREYNALWEKKRHWFNVLVEIWNIYY